MKKYAFLLILSALFISCASKKVERVYKPVNSVSISIDFENNDIAIISATYSGNVWVFFEGVELRNEAGKTREYKFKKPARYVQDSGKVFENGSLALNDYTIGDYTIRGLSNLREFIGEGEVTGRLMCDKYFEFQPVKISY